MGDLILSTITYVADEIVVEVLVDRVLSCRFIEQVPVVISLATSSADHEIQDEEQDLVHNLYDIAFVVRTTSQCPAQVVEQFLLNEVQVAATLIDVVKVLLYSRDGIRGNLFQQMRVRRAKWN